MITPTDINRILQIEESFQMPERLLSILLSDDKDIIFDAFTNLEEDLSFDWFTDYFQENHSNRSAMMQDFTPKEVTALLPMLSKSYGRVLDICAGTGGLSIGAWNRNHDAFFVCEELSARAIPLLIFNMAIRNVNGYIINKNVLSAEVIAVYKLTRSEKYSRIEQLSEEPIEQDFDLIITNPPYSLKYEWNAVPKWLAEWGEPPTKAADFAFVLYGLDKMAPAGMLLAILPHGVLFRGQKEGVIRKELITKGKVSGIIGLPEKLFLNTCIPVCVLAIENNCRDLIFIDASREFLKGSKQNRLTNEEICKICKTFNDRAELQKYSKRVSVSELEYNEYNLNISRYVDTFDPEPLPDIDEIIDELMLIKKKTKETELALTKALKGLSASDADDSRKIKKYIKFLEEGNKKEESQYEQLTFTF